MATVFLGIGTNIDPEKNIKSCADLLRLQWPDIKFSRVWKTKAKHHEDQDDFLNAAAIIETDMEAEAIYEHTKKIEKTLGKAPLFHFGPRTIDVDILLYEDQELSTPDLTIPHPEMHHRGFVLIPLAELIDIEKKHPSLGRSWKDLLEENEDEICEETVISL